jgi:signal peptidase II
LNNPENPFQINNRQEISELNNKKPNHNFLKSILPLIIGSGILITLDQWTKSLVIKNISFLGTWLPERLAHLTSEFRIVHWRNSGAAFGMFSNGNIIFLILAVIASIFIITFYPMIEKGEWSLRIAMILQLGGAVGNMLDRIKYGYVIDFISIRNLPVFNIADSCISLGVILLLVSVLVQEFKAQKNRELPQNISLSEVSRKEKTE